MDAPRIAVLPDRGVVSVSGEDARKLLQGIVTNDMELLDTRPAIFAGLLSPQGKVLFDFLVLHDANRLLLDVASDQVAALIERLAMYRLRAKAEIEDLSGAIAVVALWLPSASIGITNALAFLSIAAERFHACDETGGIAKIYRKFRGEWT